MPILNKRNKSGWYNKFNPMNKLPNNFGYMHIQTIASQFRIKHKDVESIAAELNIKPAKYSDEGYNIYSEADGQKIIDCLKG